VDLGEGNLKEDEQNYAFWSIIICMGVQYTGAVGRGSAIQVAVSIPDGVIGIYH
jgi:hypothetical protein